MKEKLELLQEAIKRESDIKEKNKELCSLGLMTEEELKKANGIHDYAINRIAELIMKF